METIVGLQIFTRVDEADSMAERPLWVGSRLFKVFN